jgi:hypothetical protein
MLPTHATLTDCPDCDGCGGAPGLVRCAASKCAALEFIELQLQKRVRKRVQQRMQVALRYSLACWRCSFNVKFLAVLKNFAKLLLRHLLLTN